VVRSAAASFSELPAEAVVSVDVPAAPAGGDVDPDGVGNACGVPGINAADAAKIQTTIGALDVESAITDRKRWPRAILNIFLYGYKLLPKSRKRDEYWWNDGF